MSDVTSLSGISGLSFNSSFPSPLLFFCLVLLLFLSCHACLCVCACSRMCVYNACVMCENNVFLYFPENSARRSPTVRKASGSFGRDEKERETACLTQYKSMSSLNSQECARAGLCG